MSVQKPTARSYCRAPSLDSIFKKHKSTEYMIRIILAGSFAVDTLIVLILSVSLIALNHTHITDRIAIGLIIFGYLIIVGILVGKTLHKVAGLMLVILYEFVGIAILHTWGINAPIGILILGFVIILASLTLGTKYILAVTTSVVLSLVILQHLALTGFTNPDSTMLDNNSSYGDVAGYSVIFLIFAVISWLSGKKTDDTLKRAIQAENKLQIERDSLAARVDEQTLTLKEAQQKEIKQLYRFAELGQLTTIILHEFANHLTVLALDIGDLEERNKNSLTIGHAKESIAYIDSIIEQVRDQINDDSNRRLFHVQQVVNDSLEQHKKNRIDSNIILHVDKRTASRDRVFGDPLRLAQVISILITNAAQARKHADSNIIIKLSATKTEVKISVRDFGIGIKPHHRQIIFEPRKDRRDSGLGVGLYITKQIIETHFGGKIWLEKTSAYTQFNIIIPGTHQNQNAPTSPSAHKSVASNPKNE